MPMKKNKIPPIAEERNVAEEEPVQPNVPEKTVHLNDDQPEDIEMLYAKPNKPDKAKHKVDTDDAKPDDAKPDSPVRPPVAKKPTPPSTLPVAKTAPKPAVPQKPSSPDGAKTMPPC